MSRAWKPGDVAMRRGPNGSEKFAVCVTGCTTHTGVGAHWHTVSKNGRADWDTLAYDGVTYRPLVVIDPEDESAVRRLVKALYLDTDPSDLPATWQAQAALREFTDPKPPKPAEPTGLGAVVEDAEGVWLVRLKGGHWADGESFPRPWSRVTAVRVLSEGVSA